MTAVTDIAAYLDELLDVATYEETEPSNGVMLDAGREVSRIAAAVNTTFASIDGAAKAGAELLLVHHSTWASIDRGLKEEKEARLRDAGVSLYCAHASLDCAPGFSTGDELAKLAGVEVEGRFAEYCGGLAGVHGRATGTFAELAGRLRNVLGVPVESWENSETFGHVAIVPGGGGMTDMLDEARSLGCDTYITGEGSMYTKLFARETGMNLFFGSHYATEAPGIKALGERVAGHFDLPWTFVDERVPS